MNDIVLRTLVLLELVILLACGAAWHIAYRPDVPRPLWRLGWVYGLVLAMVAGAIGLNLATQEPITNGLLALGVLLAVPAVVIAVLTVHQALVERRHREGAFRG